MDIYARFACRRCKAGRLTKENVFIQKLTQDDKLRIFDACGIDLLYDPPLTDDCIIRHEFTDTGEIYEMSLEEIRTNPHMRIRELGLSHPKRMYLPYQYWERIDKKRPSTQPVCPIPVIELQASLF